MLLTQIFVLIPLTVSMVSADHCFSIANNSIPCVKLCLQGDDITLAFDHSNMTVPNNANVSGMCSTVANPKQNFSKLVLSWTESGESDWLEFHFIINVERTGETEIGAKHDWYLSKIIYNQIYNNTSSNSNRTYTSLGSYVRILSSDVFSFKCAQLTANLTRNATANNSVIIHIWNYQVQAFHLSNNGTFSDPDYCLGPGFPFYVPLSVGGALLVLFLVPFAVRLLYVNCRFVKGKKNGYSLLEST